MPSWLHPTAITRRWQEFNLDASSDSITSCHWLSELAQKLWQTSTSLKYFIPSVVPSASLATGPDTHSTKAVTALESRTASRAHLSALFSSTWDTAATAVDWNIPAAQSSYSGGPMPPDKNDNDKAKPQWSILGQEQFPKPSALTQLPWNPCNKSMVPTLSLVIEMTIGNCTECMGDLNASLNAYGKHHYQSSMETCTCSAAITHRNEELTNVTIHWWQSVTAHAHSTTCSHIKISLLENKPLQTPTTIKWMLPSNLLSLLAIVEYIEQQWRMQILANFGN